MNSRFLRHLQLLLAALDLVALNAVIFFCEYLFSANFTNGSHYIDYNYFRIFLILSWVLIAASYNIYQKKYIISFELFTRRTMYVFLCFLVTIGLYLFFTRHIISRLYVSAIIGLLPVALLLNRFVYLIIYQYLKRKNYLASKVMVIGYNSLAKKLVGYLEQDGINKEVVGYCEDGSNIEELSNYPILSNINNAIDACKEHGITEIYSTIAPEQNRQIYQLIHQADESCIRFRFIPDINLFVNKQIHVDYLHELQVVSLRREPLEDMGNRIKKRAFDIIVSSFTIIFILSWLVPIIGFLIWLESKGPIFFTQLRTGKDNKSFPCLKFRSMKVNNRSHELQAVRNDSRITKIGKVLRRTSLDEFPQFFNVLRGQMSIVGPRPHMLKHTDQYSPLIGKYMVRQFLKPGITGWAQVNGHRGETKTIGQMQKRVEYDLWYLEHWSPWLDLRIIFLTVFNTIKGDKNAF